MKKPNLFIVGQPKSGTSALYEMLKDHPEICMCEEKEPSFLAKDFLEENIRHYGKNTFCHCTTFQEYLDLFENTDKKIIGEGSTHYLYSTVAAKAIYDLDPAAKIIIMLREPIDFMYALHAQQVSETREDEEDFEKALALEEQRKKGLSIPKRTRCPSYHFYKTRANYLEQIQRFVKYFPKNQIFIIIFEDFRKNNSLYLGKILDFLSVNTTVTLKPKIVNKNKSIRFRYLYHFIQSPSIKQFFRKHMKTRTYFIIKSFIDKIFFRVEKRKQLKPELRQQLKDELRPMVINLNTYFHERQFTNIDLLKIWNYHS